MKEKKLVPKRRFKEFQNTDAWQQRKLGDIAYKISVGIATSSSKHFSDSQNGVPFVKNQDIKENKLNTSNLEYISKEFDKKNINKRIQAGDILTARTGYPGVSAVVPVELNGAQTFTTLITRIIKEQATPFFVSIYINSPSGMKQINGMEAGGAQKNVNAGILQKMNIALPSLDEQYKVLEFVVSLESIIALHQSKLEKTKALKSAYLAEMFPAEGERVPKRRFAGFTGEWDIIKIGDLMDVTSVRRIHQSDWKNEGVRFLRARDIVSYSKNQRPRDILYISEDKYIEYSRVSGKVEQGDLLVTGVGTIGIPFLISNNKPIYFKDGNIIWFRNQNKVNNYFLYYSFTTKGIQNYIKTIAGIGTVGTYTIENGKQTSLYLPTIKEQQAIGEFFKKLDESITNQQQKLDKLKAMKQAYLQEMFV